MEGLVPSVIDIIVGWLTGPRRLSSDELEDWGPIKDFVESPAWDDAYGPVSSATSKSAIIAEMVDINEALASAVRSRDTGSDWFLKPDGSVTRVQVDPVEAANICLILEMRLELLQSML